MAEYVVPPEFQIRKTQVVQYEEPDPDTFYPNNQGGTGWAPMDPGLEAKVGMDPIDSYGRDPGAAAAQAGADAMRELMRITGIGQENKTRVTEYEGGSTVQYHEPTRDHQVSSVYGQAIGGDPQSVQEALLIGNKGVERAATVDAYKAREVIRRQTQGMNDGTRIAYHELLRQKGYEAVESVSAGLHEAVGAEFIKSTDSGVPLRPEMQTNNPAMAEFKELMRYHGERQRKGAAKPMAKYHPGQSNYQSRHGTFGALADLDVSAGASAALREAAPNMPALPSAPTQTRQTVASGASVAPGDSMYQNATSIREVDAAARPNVSPAQFSMLSKLYATNRTSVDTGTESFVRELPSRGSLPSLPSTPGVSTDGEVAPPRIGDADAELMQQWQQQQYDVSPDINVGQGMSKTVKIGIAVAAGLGLILLLRG